MRNLHSINRNHPWLEKSRVLIVLLVAIAVLSIVPRPSQIISATPIEESVVLDPTTAPMLTGSAQVVNNGPGDQTDPQIDCNRASYTNDDFLGALTIRYFDFATNTDNGIPGNGVDLLSDVFGGTVAFTEATPSGSQVVLFDIATQTRTVTPGFKNSHPVLGGNLVVFETRIFSSDPNENELMVYDRSNNEITRLTSDLSFDKSVAVSPTGNAIVWEKCHTTGFGCDIYSAIQNGPGDFTTRFLTGAPSEEHQPATNGQIVVYISNQSGENDIYFQPVTGGPQIHLSIPGDQRNVSIAGNLISFESAIPLGNGMEYDIFVYDINTGNLYRATNTAVDETLNEITTCNGMARVVYGAPAIDFNVFAFTFQPPSSAENQIEDLIELVESFNLPQGSENSLITKLEDALAAVQAADTPAACDLLSAFINECQAQSGKKLTADQASQLTSSATQIKTNLGCQ